MFRKPCLAIVTALMLLCAFNNISAQVQHASVTDVTPALLDWTKHLNSAADKYVTKEKAEELGQHLELLRQDLTSYMKARKRLSDSLFRNNIAPGKKDPASLQMLKEKMSTVMQRMRDVTDLTNDELRTEGDKLNDKIYHILYEEEGRYPSNLEAFLDGFDVTKKDMALDASMCYQRLEDCVNLISSLLDKVNRYRK
ncbi:hypothetical protein [Chitinophaga sp. 212800010-3]|uniref:hypothetical protein n=1 Tax=unclassified Chitinophaga TaxID=2619133 RepID=UPI002DEA94CE|nr:OmpH family outer membrane protein [Chitinophaga sp. 212800010-3]